MVYCPKCGTQNEDTAEFCLKCGANLQTGTYASRRLERIRAEQECFGLPHGGAIVALAIGIIVLIWVFFQLANAMHWISSTSDLGFIALIVFGVLLIAGAAYGITRRKTPQ